MGRKIPAKKHRGVKDPLEQQARRLQSLKGKINAPPTDPEEQPVPRSLQLLFAPRPPRAARAAHHPPNHTGGAAGGGSGASGSPVARLRRGPGESAREFSRRITHATRALHAAAPLHYPGEEEEEEDRRGMRMSDVRERRARRQRRAAGGRPPAVAAPPALTRTQKLALKKKAKRELADEAARCERREVVVERVPLGAVAHAPPDLRPPRGARTHTAATSRPGRRGLLLTALLQAGGAGAGAARAPAPAAEARRRERAREDAVAAYRALKTARRRT